MICHPTCAECDGPEANQCTSCPTALRLVSGECTSICENGFYRGSGQVSATATITVPGLFAEIFDTDEQALFRQAVTSMVSATLDAEKAADARLLALDTSTATTAMILSIAASAGATGLDIEVKLYSDQEYYEYNAMAI